MRTVGGEGMVWYLEVGTVGGEGGWYLEVGRRPEVLKT